METRLSFRNILSISLFALLFIMGVNLNAQQANDVQLENFKIGVTMTDNGVALHGVEGLYWLNLSFSLKGKRAQAVNKNGMTKSTKGVKSSASNDNSLLFTVSKTGNKINLTGINGTAWKTLSFTLTPGETQFINQYGTVN